MAESMGAKPKFREGEIVHHLRLDYRAVVTSVDDEFRGEDDTYAAAAKAVSRSKDEPWYHLLVHSSRRQTYVSEAFLERDRTGEPVDHPYVPIFFDEFRDGRYVRTRPMN